MSVADRDQYIAEDAAAIKSGNQTSVVDTSMGQVMVEAESSKPVNGVQTVAGDSGRINKGGTQRAKGLCQMFPKAVADAHKLLTGKSPTGSELQALYDRVVANPRESIRYAMAHMAAIENRVMAWGVVKSAGIRETSHLQSIIMACYHLGEGTVRPMVASACSPPPFDIDKFTQAYEDACKDTEGAVSDRVRRISGTVGGASSGKEMQRVLTGPTDGNARENNAIALSFNVTDSTPITPLRVIQDGLDAAAWFEGDPTLPGKLTGNPHLRGIPAPAWFELRLNRTDGTSLVSPTTGQPLKVVLNVSLASVNIRSQHVVNREPTATGLMITFWGSQPDMIVGRGSTGAFINQTGLTALMSNRLTPAASGWWDMIQQAYAQFDTDGGRTRASAKTLHALWGKGGVGADRFRVAAQDSFAELLALFKNNGVTRFLPLSWMAAQRDPSMFLSNVMNSNVWSPASGATGFQMLARAGDVHARGYVAFKYKGATYLGYFKGFNFTADAKSPFKWDFDFTFRVLKSLTPMYYAAK